MSAIGSYPLSLHDALPISGMSRLTPSTARLAPNALVSPASRIPAIAPLLSQEAEAEALHQVLLDQEAQRDHRQGGDRADGRLRAVVSPLVDRLELVEGDRDRGDLGAGEGEGQEQLAPVEDEDEQERRHQAGH